MMWDSATPITQVITTRVSITCVDGREFLRALEKIPSTWHIVKSQGPNLPLVFDVPGNVTRADIESVMGPFTN